MINWFKRNWREIADTAILFILLVSFFFAGFIIRGYIDKKETGFWKSIFSSDDPTQCALCGSGNGLRYHAPCLVQLSTGEVIELIVYDPHPTKVGEIAEDQRTGFAQLINQAGVSGLRDASNHVCHATLPQEFETMEASHFCHNCRMLLASVSTEGYVLLDLYDLNAIVPYVVKDNANYIIRDYTVTIDYDMELERYKINVQGNIS